MAIADVLAPTRWSPPRGKAAPTRAQRREAEALGEVLARRIAGEVRFDAGSRALYATDLSIYRQVPVGVVIPKTVEDVEATLEACRARDVPVLGRGCGTSLSGQTCNVAVVLDFSKYMTGSWRSTRTAGMPGSSPASSTINCGTPRCASG